MLRYKKVNFIKKIDEILKNVTIFKFSPLF